MAELIYRKTSELKPHPQNPRVHPKKLLEKLEQSIKTYGFTNPVLIDKNDIILAGHARCKTAEKMGIEEVPTITLAIEGITADAYLIADNKLNEMAKWDKDLLAELIADLESRAFDVSLTGFDEGELQRMFPKEAHEDDFDIDGELEKEQTVTKQGDIWILGRHRLICGDSTHAETYDKLLGGVKANLCVTDPPYLVDYEGSAGKIKNDNLKGSEAMDFLRSAFDRIFENTDEQASVYVFHADTGAFLFRQAFVDAGFLLDTTCIWEKQSLVLGRSPYQWKHEPCLFGYKKNQTPNWYGGKNQSSVWPFDRPAKSELHPTMKPIELIAHCINNSSQENAIVLEPFAGSGSCLIACEQLGRTSYNIELDEKFCDVIVERFRNSYPDQRLEKA